MDQSSVQSIAGYALAADGKRYLDTDTRTVILRTENGGEKIVSLEPYGAGRARYRGTFATVSLDAFIAHVALAEAGESVGFVDPERMSATVYFNLGTPDDPGHGDHLAKLVLPKTAAYSALLQSVSRAHSQRTLAEWIEDWRDFLVPTTDGKASGDSIAKVVAAIRDVTVKTAREVTTEERDFGTTQSAMASVDAQSRHVLPGGFLFTCEPYAGLPARTFSLRLGVVTTDDKVGFTLRIQQAEQQDELIAKDFEAVLSKGLEKVDLSIGTFTP